MTKKEEEIGKLVPFHTFLWPVCLKLSQKDPQSKPYHCKEKVIINKKSGITILQQT